MLSLFVFAIVVFVVGLCDLTAVNGDYSGGNNGDNDNSDSSDSDDSSESELIAIELEGGSCLYGSEYTYFIRPGDPKYVTIIFNGGGFCFDSDTCPETEDVPVDRYLAVDPPLINGLPLMDDSLTWTVIILPQCTEDFHIGNQVNYPLDADNGVFADFVGGNNVNLILNDILSKNDSLEVTQYVDFDVIKHLVLWGTSSGNLGASAWGYQIFDYVSEDALKTLIIDGWAIDSGLASSLSDAIAAIYNLVGSPAFIPDFLPLLVASELTLTNLILGLQSKYCELFVSSLYFEYDTDQTGIYAFLLSDASWLLFDTWAAHMRNTILPEALTYDAKRSSFYVSKGNNHVFLFPQFDINDTSDISTECEEDATAQEYLTLVIGNKKTVKTYYGEPQMRVKTFPKYSWNNLNNTCLEC